MTVADVQYFTGETELQRALSIDISIYTMVVCARTGVTVSYTHLTLPTIYSV